TDALGSLATVASKDSGDWEIVHTTTSEYGGDQQRFGDTGSESLMSLNIWAGHFRDPDTGLIQAKARWYDSESGRFVSPDPMGFAAGDENLYRYVGNGPGNATDPTGLAEYVPKGPYYATGNPFSTVMTQEEFIANGGNGFKLVVGSDGGQKAVEYVNGRPNFTPHVAKIGGRPVVVRIPATGISGADISSAYGLAITEFGEEVRNLDLTPHHASFDRATGEMIMEFVDTSVHKPLRHKGGYGDFLDWAAEVLTDSTKVAGLSDDMAASIHAALRSGTSNKQRLLNKIPDVEYLSPSTWRIGNSAAHDLIIEKSARHASTVVMVGDTPVFEVVEDRVGKGKGRWVVRSVKVGAKISGVGLVVVGGYQSYMAYNSAMLQTGDRRLAMIAGLREASYEPIVRGAVGMTIVPVGQELNRARDAAAALNRVMSKHGIEPF
ncbi:MAG: RHS repeat-associated core domain-containing protein, partial [Rubripirellula sp.]